MNSGDFRTTRKNLASILNGDGPHLVGEPRYPRALIVPIKKPTWKPRVDLNKQLAKAQGAANWAFRELRK